MNFHLDWFGCRISRLRHQGLRRLDVISDVKGRFAEPRVAGRHCAFGLGHHAAQQLLHTAAINAQVGGLTHPFVEPR